MIGEASFSLIPPEPEPLKLGLFIPIVGFLKFEEAANNFGVIVRRDIRLATLQYLLILSQIDNNEEALYSQNSKRRILVVDNETDITITLQVGLEDGGFDVDVFNDPDLALKRFKPNFYDLVLIDIMMPKIDGFELYERLRKIDPDIKVCFLTASEAYHEEFRKAEHCSLNKDLFLQKPISTDDLIMEVSKKLDSHNNG